MAARSLAAGVNTSARGFFSLAQQFFFDFFQLFFKRLVEKVSLLAPWLALGIRLSGVGNHFPAVYILVTLRLALEFGAQFVFRHLVTHGLEKNVGLDARHAA
jgi:hypothetical protein